MIKLIKRKIWNFLLKNLHTKLLAVLWRFTAFLVPASRNIFITGHWLWKRKFEEEFELPVFYKGDKIGLRRVDFWIQNTISLEIKAKSDLDNSHLARGINYVEAPNIAAGLLINFGSPSLQFKRLDNKLLFPPTPIV